MTLKLTSLRMVSIAVRRTRNIPNVSLSLVPSTLSPSLSPSPSPLYPMLFLDAVDSLPNRLNPKIKVKNSILYRAPNL
ncbi:Phosphoglycerate mutase-like protein AT74 [Fusarium oxysporum f. sp. albedinis]|nr:Phosphoglycerate mutase-like protein AT74 [Fusarium oxysporum f. sp. albedinis]